MNEHEEKTLTSFFIKEKRERYRFLLGNPRRRAEATNRLNHCQHLQLDYVVWQRSNADIAQLLRKHGSPEQVYVISGNDAIDGQTMPLEDAIEATSMGGWGTIISCIPGRLAYYYDEEGERRALLIRK